MNVLELLRENLLKDSLILISIYVGLGCLLQKKGLEKTINAMIKAAIAIFMMNIGGNTIGLSLANLTYMFQRSFGHIGIVANNERLAAYADMKFGNVIYTMMILGMVVNLGMAKWTKHKYIFLTGHQMLYMSCVLSILLKGFGMSYTAVIGIGGLVLGAMMTWFPAILQPYTQKITGRDNVAVGHFSTLGFWLSAQIGLAFRTEAKANQAPKKHTLLADNMLATTVSMMGIFMLASLLAGQAYVEDITNSHYIVFAVKQGIYFATGVFIIITGVRMMTQEIMFAFKGIAEKVVPNAVPALDCSILFPYKQDVLVLGFVGSMIGGVLAMLVGGHYSIYIIIPSSTLCFFSGSAAGIYGYSTGGKWGAGVSAVVFGFCIGIMPLFFMDNMAKVGFYKIAMGEFDFSILSLVAKAIQSIGGLV